MSCAGFFSTFASLLDTSDFLSGPAAFFAAPAGGLDAMGFLLSDDFGGIFACGFEFLRLVDNVAKRCLRIKSRNVDDDRRKARGMLAV